MGWSFRKSLRLLPGIRINPSKSGPRLSVGVPVARASINLRGKVRLYGGKGPIQFQKSLTVGPEHSQHTKTEKLQNVWTRLFRNW
jgi:hypothetical protein